MPLKCQDMAGCLPQTEIPDLIANFCELQAWNVTNVWLKLYDFNKQKLGFEIQTIVMVFFFFIENTS